MSPTTEKKRTYSELCPYDLLGEGHSDPWPLRRPRKGQKATYGPYDRLGKDRKGPMAPTTAYDRGHSQAIPVVLRRWTRLGDVGRRWTRLAPTPRLAAHRTVHGSYLTLKTLIAKRCPGISIVPFPRGCSQA